MSYRGRRPSIHRRETGQGYLGPVARTGYLGPVARTGPYIDLPVVCSIHVSSMSVRKELRLSTAPPSSSRFHQQQSKYNYFLIHIVFIIIIVLFYCSNSSSNETTQNCIPVQFNEKENSY
ncbi:unnamed protein product, partial [Rotaria magnacalcarata]